MSCDEVSDVLEEAQALMDDLVVGNSGDDDGDVVIDGFSIDDVMDDVGLEPPAIDARSKVKEGEDPLSAINSNDHPLTSTATTPENLPLVDTPPTSAPTPINLASINSAQLNAGLADVKARATGFASSMANFAQKAAANVAAAAAAQPVASNMSLSNSNSNIAATAAANNQVPFQTPVIELDNEQKTALIQKHLGNLLPGERVIMFLTNLLHVSDSSGWEYNYNGTAEEMWCCCMTYYRVVLFHTSDKQQQEPVPPGWDVDCWPARPTVRQLQMPLASMERVEKSVYTTSQNTTLMGLIMHGKDNGRQLRFTTTSYGDTLRVHESIQTYAFPGRRNLGYLFAFESKREDVVKSVDPETKQITLPPTAKRFDPIPEFRRQFGASSIWNIYEKTNEKYQLCSSYPSVLIGPASLPEVAPETQRLLRQMANFRSEGRIPALTWSSSRGDGASLWRASQPKVGLQGNRNSSDEFWLRHIAEASAAVPKPALPSKEWIQKVTGQPDGMGLTLSCSLKIMDLRPRSSAMANRTSGYGYENTTNYPGSTLTFYNITNIHGVRDAYQKMSTLCMSPSTSDVNFSALIEDTKWLHHIRLIWNASWEAAYTLHVHRVPVLLHCSHGWDRTSQVAALAQLLMDPYYRTRAGFACLVDKDFLSFGHPFHTRCAHGEGKDSGTTSSSDEGQISPIFLQFLDCVYQLVTLLPDKFEFSAMYLLVLSENVYSCRFGTLLCDTERERDLVAGIRQRTHSIWDYLEHRDDCINPNFESSPDILLMPLPLLLRHVHLWKDRHCLHGPKAVEAIDPSKLVL
mmetsp:Transcript_16016/g.23563  ORF Transcript_16016/g.23563 Transcript_16016/m.23563 type:complete len:802 (-) Transcript_16016:465-2870(-)|eukprot:CAMPEP_0194227468 /NCGR_PEP_ID=MMETSP0156-20130528/42872_1 /TAXON_ID=33649 /ORGANISM="Thalassionema nitzschioides, Strain L26-B" /LENGTH=801 /DNA_ID=CAMNT_0038959949 /DNA_START=38 /DNA_END=2443 /DNA_ORIENTATION=-